MDDQTAYNYWCTFIHLHLCIYIDIFGILVLVLNNTSNLEVI